MAKFMPKKVLMGNLSEHPAVLAWIQLNPRHKVPERVEIIRETRTINPSVYRLCGIGFGASSVIAKRCQTELARLDRTFYEDVLPHIPLPSAHYYGFLDEGDQIGWLFLEDAGDVKYSPNIEEHRVLATQWMGIFHTSTELVPPSVLLPDRGFIYYLDHLRTARDTIQGNLSNPVLDTDDLILLRKIISQCDHVESKWSEVVSICDGTPRTLTHGDFKNKNIYLRPSNGVTDLMVLDWETAGIGIPTIDVAAAKVDINAYWLRVRDIWPNLDFRTIQDLAEVGKILRYLAAINWAAQSLPYKWISKSMAKMNVYQVRIGAALQAINLVD